MLKNIVDGWALNAAIRYLPFRATPMLLGQMEPLRRANNYRPRIWVLPDVMTVPIPAYGQYNRQIRVVPDSYWWAASLYEFTDGNVAIPPADLTIQITDETTGCQLSSEFIQGGVFGQGNGQIIPALLTQPRLIAAPGLLSVQIANTAVTPVKAQLLLCFLEPCDKILEESQCP